MTNNNRFGRSFNISNFEVYKYVLTERKDKDLAKMYARIYSSVEEYIQDMIYESWGEDN